MAEILLYCKEPEGLRLGPDSTEDGVIHFHRGFARFDEADFPNWRAWVNHPRTPPIVELPPDGDMQPPGEAGSVTCPICDKTLRNEFALTGHLRSHAPKG